MAIAIRILRADRRGSSWPVLAETSEGLFFTKLRGAAQGTSALVAEVVVAELAAALGLLVPAWRTVTLPPGIACDDPNDELRDLLGRSTGENIGFEYLEAARDLQAAEAPRLDRAFAARVLWLDTFVQNVDRTATNPNIMVRRGRYYLIDHGVALPFHHDWAGITESSPLRSYDGTGHLFARAAPDLAAITADATRVLTRDVIAGAVDHVPESLLSGDTTRRRAAYTAFLWKRLRAMPT